MHLQGMAFALHHSFYAEFERGERPPPLARKLLECRRPPPLARQLLCAPLARKLRERRRPPPLAREMHSVGSRASWHDTCIVAVEVLQSLVDNSVDNLLISLGHVELSTND